MYYCRSALWTTRLAAICNLLHLGIWMNGRGSLSECPKALELRLPCRVRSAFVGYDDASPPPFAREGRPRLDVVGRTPWALAEVSLPNRAAMAPRRVAASRSMSASTASTRACN